MSWQCNRLAIAILAAWGCAQSQPAQKADQPAAPAAPAEPAKPAAEADPWAHAELIQPPTPSAPQPFKVQGLTRFALRSGLPVLVIARHDLPAVDLALSVRVGGLDDPTDKQGISQFVADMLRKGTKRRTADQISELIDSLGGTLQASAGEESTTVHCGALAKDFATCLDLLSDITVRPTFPDKEMGEVRDRIIAGIEGVRDNKDALADQHFGNQLFGDAHPKGMIATKESVAALKRTDLEAFHKKYFVAQNALLAIAGDVDPTKIKPALERALAGWARGKKNARTEPAIPAHSGLHVLLVDKPDLAQTRIVLGHAGIRHRDPDYFATILANYSLGGGAFSSRLMARVRAKGGKTYGIHSGFETGEWIGDFQVSTDVPNEEAVSVIADIRDEMKKMRAAGPSETELRDAKTHIAGAYAMRLQTPSSVAGAIVAAELHGLGLDYVENYPLKVAAVTVADARAAAAKHLDPGNVVLVLVGKGDMVGPALTKAGIKAQRVAYTDPISALARKQASAAKSTILSASAAEVGKAKALIDLALRAAGGADKLKGVRDVTVIAKMSVAGQKVSVKQYVLLPDKHRMDMNMGGMDVKMVITKDVAFQQAGPQVMDLPPAMAAKVRKEQRAGLPTEVLVRASEPTAKVVARPTVEEGGKKLDVVEMIDRDGETTTLWIDAKTHLLSKVGDNDGAAELDDWRDVAGGIKFPFKMRLRGKQSVDLETEEVKINSGLSPDLFKR